MLKFTIVYHRSVDLHCNFRIRRFHHRNTVSKKGRKGLSVVTVCQLLLGTLKRSLRQINFSCFCMLGLAFIVPNCELENLYGHPMDNSTLLQDDDRVSTEF